MRPAARHLPAPTEADTGTSWLLFIFMFSLFVPGYIPAGPLLLNPYKLVLLLATVPLGVMWLRGRAGPVVAPDLFMLGYCLWQALSIVVHHGLTRIPFIGTTFVENFGAYLVGRVLVRSAAGHLAFFRYLLICFAVLLPFALIELLTGVRIWRDIFSNGLTMGGNVRNEKRLGLTRVYLGLPHPIHVGFVASVAFANVYYIFSTPWTRLSRSGLVGFFTFVGISSGPMLAVGLQGVMIAWDGIVRFLRGHWVLFGMIGVISLAVLQMTLPGGIVGYLVNEVIFNSTGGENRINIFRYGMAEVIRHPVLGIGLNDWVRPWWQHATLDNFWLLTTMRNGIPGLLMLGLAIGVSAFRISTEPGLDETEARYRTGYLVALVGSVVVLGTVHIWDSPIAFLMAYVGAGVWFYTRSTAALDPAPRRREGRAAVPAAAGRIPAAGGLAPAANPLPGLVAGPPGAGARDARRRSSRQAALDRRAAGSRPER